MRKLNGIVAPMLDTYLDLLDLAYFEASVAFEGLADENVWKRPAERLVSIGELAGHIAFWEAMRFAAEGDESGRPKQETCRVKSILLDDRFSYYPHSMALPPSEEHQAMTAQQVWSELKRIHEESVSHLKSQNPHIDAPPPGWSSGGSTGFTLREMLKYQIFHVGYHVGQIYSARYLLGEEPPDN
jgi:hypothetical protein